MVGTILSVGVIAHNQVSSSSVRGLTKRWLFRPELETLPKLGQSSIIPLIDRILHARGLAGQDQFRRFCQPKLTDLHDPQLLPNIDSAASKLVEAIRAGRNLVIYGDYDVDGITGTAILYHVIKAVAPEANLKTYVPHRLEEGYGLSSDALRQLKNDGANLVISVDCGITAVEPALVAKKIGLDLIITDHHCPPENEGDLPDAIAIVHPSIKGSVYPFSDLCGAGVAFKLAWHFATTWCNSKRVGESLQKTLLDMLPLAALGTIADVVPLVDENRTIAMFGLRWIKQTPIAGLKALIEVSGLMEDNIDSEKVGFILAPRLNACGRMGHAEDAIKLLTTAQGQEAITIAEQLTTLNRQRQKTQRDIVDHAIRLVEDSGMANDDCRMIVLAHESWHRGVIGIVCSRLVEKFGRPTILLQNENGICKGSARSIDGYSIHQALLSCNEYLLTYGGHDAAAGLSLESAKLNAFTEAIGEHAKANITKEQLVPVIKIDCDAQLAEIDLETTKRIAALSPFGRANPKPAIRVQKTTIAEAPKQIGSNGKHLSLRLRQDDSNSRSTLRAVWWNAGNLASDLAAGMHIDVVIEPKINVWNGRTSVEAELKDVRLCEV